MMSKNKEVWVHLLFRGEKRLGQEHVDQYTKQFSSRGLAALTIPILDFRFKNLEELSHQFKFNSSHEETKEINGLIITSPRAVEAVRRAKAMIYNERMIEFNPDYVFVVGDRSSRDLEMKVELRCNASSTHSGSSRCLVEFIKTHCKDVPSRISLVYPKGSLADYSIEEALRGEQNVHVNPIVVYETIPIDNLSEIIVDKIEDLKINNETADLVVNLIFFSPSGVESFLKLGEEALTEILISRYPGCVIKFKYSSIGRTTEAALLRNGTPVFCVSDRPNPEAMAECVLKSFSEYKK